MMMANQTENIRGGGREVGMGTVFTVPREGDTELQYYHREGLYHSTKDLCLKHPEGLCSQYSQRRTILIVPREGGCTHIIHRERGCAHSTHREQDCAHSTHRGGLHLLILTGVDEFHQDELLHMLMENVLQRPSPFFPQPCSEFLPREHRS